MKSLLILFACTITMASQGQFVVMMTKKDELEYLNAHNKWRKEVGSPPLTWNKSFQEDAEWYAAKLAKTGKMEHSDTDLGENLFWFSEKVCEPEMAVNAWASEKEYYRPGTKINNSNYQKFGHYTQMIWYNTTEVGCGAAQSKHGTFVVCRYNPHGNIIGEKPIP